MSLTHLLIHYQYLTTNFLFAKMELVSGFSQHYGKGSLLLGLLFFFLKLVYTGNELLSNMKGAGN